MFLWLSLCLGVSAADVLKEAPPIDLSSTIVVVAPHPDDETLGFGGMLYDARQGGRSIRIIVVTDGQSYCRACAFWRAGRPPRENEAPCSLADLDALGRARRAETLVAAGILGVKDKDVTFLGHVDGTLESAWKAPDTPPSRITCDAKSKGKGSKTADELVDELRTAFLAAPGGNAPLTVFTTSPDDGHPDHATLGEIVRSTLRDLPRPSRLYTAVIHNHAHDNCAYPNPAQPTPGLCRSGHPDDRFVAAHLKDLATWRALRLRPDAAWETPTDYEYGESISYPLSEAARLAKRRAVAAYKSQIGTGTRVGTPSKDVSAWVDCIGYMNAFDHTNELFYDTELHREPDTLP